MYEDPIDKFLLKKFQSFSDFIQTWLGYNNFDLARLCRIIMITGLLSRAFCSYISGSIFGLVWSLIFCMILSMYTKKVINELESEVRNNPVFTNPGVLKYSLQRLISQYMIIMGLFGLITEIFHLINFNDEYKKIYPHLGVLAGEISYLSFASTLYFSCCTPKPHKPSKVKKMIEKGKEAIQQIRTPGLKPAFIISK